jgi:hypothetical protein
MKEYHFLLKNEKRKLYDRFAIFLTILVVAATFFNGWFGIGMAIILLFYFLTRRKLRVDFNDHSISFPSFPRRSIHWNKLNNVMVKDGLLTIDFKDNRIIQQTIEENQSVNEQEFNEFCKRQLTIHY